MQRLQTRPQFQAVLAGAIVAKTTHFALHRNSLDAVASKSRDCAVNQRPLFPSKELWLGAMVPKRWARRAVTRNAIKRQIYAVSADFQDIYPQAAFVVRLRRDFSRVEFVSATSLQLRLAVRGELLSLLQAGAVAP
ncbi:MAG: ribonuclease P protein component [Polaromonas sp.]|nr:ribonuclease P protein component [Polaromonas sp.]